MSSPSRPPSYIAVLRTPHACRTFGAALLGRLSYGTVFLSLILALTGTTGSYGVAGGVMALFGIASSLLSPLRAGLIDRYGARRALPPMAVVYALLLACLAVATWRPGTAGVPLAALAVAAGACTPPLGPVMRALWSELLPDRLLLQRAYSLDTVAEELLFVAGPLLAGLLAALATPAAGVAVSAALVVIGTLALVSSPALRAAGTSRAGDGPGEGPAAGAAGDPDPGPIPSRLRWTRDAAGSGGGLIQPVMVSGGVGMCLGALSLLTVVFAERHHQAAAVAWVEAALAVGSALGGLIYGALSWRVSEQVRLPLLAAAMGLALAVAGLSPDLYVLVATVGVTGLFVAPALTTAYLLADESAAPENRTRASAWVNTAFNTGSSAGTAATGLLVGNLPLALCFAVAAVPALLSVTATLGRLRRSVTVSPLER
ncbi:MFS transporter [Streptosporangium sp. NPDC051023]|uniref:MFS transporter n=1 Tax=Streptosporangium sp. NPDC051023 TaxID=3155410 RepID=UPI00344F5576